LKFLVQHTPGYYVAGVEPLNSHLRLLGQKFDAEIIHLNLLLAGSVYADGIWNAYQQAHILCKKIHNSVKNNAIFVYFCFFLNDCDISPIYIFMFKEVLLFLPNQATFLFKAQS